MLENTSGQKDFGILLLLAYAKFKRELHQTLHGQGFNDLGTSFGFVFRVLEDSPLNLRGLADRLGISPQGALKIVDEMVVKKYVLRVPDPNDGRATILKLAPRGERAFGAARRFHHEFERSLATTIGEKYVSNTRLALTELIGDSNETMASVRLL